LDIFWTTKAKFMNQTAQETTAPALQDVAIFDGNGENEKSLRNLEKLRNSGFFQKLGDSPANLLINQGVMATLQERRLGYHSRAGLEPGTSGFSTLRINHYAARGIQRIYPENRIKIPQGLR
jgi:hypothetical protein